MEKGEPLPIESLRCGEVVGILGIWTELGEPLGSPTVESNPGELFAGDAYAESTTSFGAEFTLLLLSVDAASTVTMEDPLAEGDDNVRRPANGGFVPRDVGVFTGVVTGVAMVGATGAGAVVITCAIIGVDVGTTIVAGNVVEVGLADKRNCISLSMRSTMPNS